MRIAIATTQLGPGYRHGSEHYVESLGAELARRGHEVAWLAGDPLGVRSASRFSRADFLGRSLFACPTGSWLAVEGARPSAYADWLSGWRPDVLHVASASHIGVGVVRAAFQRGIPVVVTAMDFWWICPRATLLRDGAEPCDGSPGWRACLRCLSSDHPRRSVRAGTGVPAPLALAVRGSAAIARGARPSDVRRFTRRREELVGVLDGVAQLIFPSQAMRDAVAPALTHDRHRVIPYGLDESWFASPAPERRAPRSGKSIAIGFAGSLRPHKGADLLLDAVARLGWSEARIRVAGAEDDAAFARRLREQARRLSVEFAGPLSRAQMRDFHRSLDVLVVPSRWTENLPFALLEAQAAGVAVVGSDVPGIRERLPQPSRRFRRGDASDLARALRDFVAETRELPAPAVSSLAEMADRTEAVYHDATRGVRT